MNREQWADKSITYLVENTHSPCPEARQLTGPLFALENNQAAPAYSTYPV